MPLPKFLSNEVAFKVISETQMFLDSLRDLRCLDHSCLSCSKTIKNSHFIQDIIRN